MTCDKLRTEVLGQFVCFLESSVGTNSLAECLLSVFTHMNNWGLVNVEQDWNNICGVGICDDGVDCEA